jgi:acetolactate synthase-1/2/3 large subunit
MAQLTGGQALVQSIKRKGSDTIFALPGAQLDWAFDALHMADGYARATGKVGTCLVVPGPGVLNAGAGLSTAYACASPVLCLAGQIASRLIGVGRGELHEIKDQRAVLESVSKWTGRALAPSEVPGLVRAVFEQLRNGRPAPVSLEIPPDVLSKTEEVTLLDGQARRERLAPDPAAIRGAAEALAGAERPAMYVGSGVLQSEAWDEVRALAEALEMPVVMSRNGRGALSARHPLALNPVAGLELLPTCDVVLAVGTRFLEPSQGWDLPQGQRFIQIDIESSEVGRNLEPTVGIVADAKLALAALRAEIDGVKPKAQSRREELVAIRERAEDTLHEAEGTGRRAG